jgi:hypothetical protein
MEIYITYEVVAKRLPKGSFEMLREAFYRGSIQRGQAREITGYEERRARGTLSTLLDRGLLVTTGPCAPVSLGFPSEVLDRWLPNLYPMDAPSSPGAQGATVGELDKFILDAPLQDGWRATGIHEVQRDQPNRCPWLILTAILRPYHRTVLSM